MKKCIKFLISFFIVAASFPSLSFAVRLSEDSPQGPSQNKNSDDILDHILAEFIMPQTNGAHLSAVLDKARALVGEKKVDGNLIEKALDLQFQQLITAFNPRVQEALKEAWKTSDWVTYNPRAENTFLSRPVGSVRISTPESFSVILDSRLKKLPLISRILQMVLLTHRLAPQLQILDQEGIAFYRETNDIQEVFSATMSYWALTHWLKSPQLSKVLDQEIRTSTLSLPDIRSTLEFITSFRNRDEIDLLNYFLETQYIYIISSQNPLNLHLQTWLHGSLLAPPGPQRPVEEAPTDKPRIISFVPKAKNIQCHSVLNPHIN